MQEASNRIMKLADWRNRSYPLRILVDNREVFRGDSERSLGYVSSNFPPTEGRSVRVELVGASTEGDAFSDIVEVAEPNLSDNNDVEQNRDNAAEERGQQRAGRNAALRIVELEIYESSAP